METKKKEMTWNDIFHRSIIVNALPLGGLRGKDLSEVIMLQVDYGKLTSAFNSRMEEGVKKLKAERYPDFDAESQKPEGERLAEYKDWLKGLEAAAAEMRTEAASKAAEGVAVPRIPREVLTAVCADGIEGEVRLPGGSDASPNMVRKSEILYQLAMFVED